MKRLLLVVGLLTGLILLNPSAALACSCVVSTTAQQVSRAETIVDGRLEWIASDGIETTYGVKVTNLYKGKAAVREKLVGSASEASCGLGDLATNKRYLFFIKGVHRGTMSVSLCTGTAPYNAVLAAKIAAITGPPTGPYVAPGVQPVQVDDSTGSGTSVWTVLGSAVVVIGGAVAGLRFYARRGSRG